MPDIACALKRYDGSSGSATFTGCIPLQPGQLFETNTGLSSGTVLVAQASLRGNVSLWRTAGPTEMQAYITALYPQHPDGSIKVVMVSTTLSVADGEEIPLTLKVGTSPSLAASPSAHPTINALWMKFPRLIGCTDATHMCASQVALGPLVRVDDPRLPAQWQRLLTYEMDEAPSMRSGSGLRNRGAQGYPTYSEIFDCLEHFGNLGTFLCRLTHGSNVVTIIDPGWPTASSAPTAQLLIGDRVDTTGLSGQARPISVGTTITAIDANGTDFTISTTADLSLSVFTPQLGALPRTNGQQVEFEVTCANYNILIADANYNVLAPLYLRYMTAVSGHLDKLRMAHLMACTREHDSFTWVGRGNHHTHGVVNHGNASGGSAFARYHGAYTDAAGVVHAHMEEFPIDEYGQPHNFSVTGNQASSSGWKESAWLCYVLSGWRQPMGALISFHLPAYGTSPGGPLTYLPFKDWPWAGTGTTGIGPGAVFHTPSQPGGWDGPRMNWRAYRSGDLLLFMLSLPFSLNTNVGGHVAMSPRMATYPYTTPAADSNRGKYFTYFQRKYWDSVDYWSTETYPNGTQGYPQNPTCPHTCSGPQVGSGVAPELGAQFLAGLWGFSNRYIQFGTIALDPQYRRYSGMAPLFQLQLMFNTLVQCHIHVKTDDLGRLAPKMSQLGEWLATVQNVVGGVEQKQLISSNPNAPVGHGFVYATPYQSVHPQNLATPPIVPPGYPFAGTQDFFNRHPWVTGMVFGLLTWTWRVTGHPKLLAMIDGHATIYSNGRGSSGNTLAPNDYALKYLGEYWHHVHYAAAWRAGESLGVPGAVPSLSPPVITGTPYEAGDTSVTGTGVAGGTVTLFRNAVPGGPQPIDGTGHWVYAVTALIAGEVLVATQSNGSQTSGGSSPVTVQAAPLPDAPTITGTPYHAGDVLVSGTGIVGAVVHLTRNGIAVSGSATVSGTGVWSKPVTALIAGDVLTATQTTGTGTSLPSNSITVLNLPPVEQPPVSGEGNFLLLEGALPSGFLLLETGDALLLETGDKVLLDLPGDRLLIEFTTSAASRLLLETGDTLLLETGDDVLLEGEGFEGTTELGGLLLEGLTLAPGAGASHQRRTYGRSRSGVRGWGG